MKPPATTHATRGLTRQSSAPPHLRRRENGNTNCRTRFRATQCKCRMCELATNKTTTHGGEVLRRPPFLFAGWTKLTAAPRTNPRRTASDLAPLAVARRAGRRSAARDYQTPPPSVVRKMIPASPTMVPVFASVNDTSWRGSEVPLVCSTHVAPPSVVRKIIPRRSPPPRRP